jgi:hypothetical protein
MDLNNYSKMKLKTDPEMDATSIPKRRLSREGTRAKTLLNPCTKTRFRKDTDPRKVPKLDLNTTSKHHHNVIMSTSKTSPTWTSKAIPK